MLWRLCHSETQVAHRWLSEYLTFTRYTNTKGGQDREDVRYIPANSREMIMMTCALSSSYRNDVYRLSASSAEKGGRKGGREGGVCHLSTRL